MTDDAPRTAFRRWHPETSQQTYALHGRVTVPGFLDAGTALDLADMAADHVHRMPRIDLDSRPARNLDEGGPYHHWAAPTDLSLTILPVLDGLYHAARLVTEAVTCRPVILSPYPQSRITLKVYGFRDCQGWHRDTNPVTALLVLRGSSPTFGARQIDRPAPVAPGSLLVFAGRHFRHMVPAEERRVPKVAVAFNLYHPEDTWRPADMDGLVYEGA